ncbi:hypothetical protein NQ314_015260 [Rhamnusium bicolor]|uniref:Zinc finger CW-type PWWP domain protein 1 n=1 Tax=Rhamnusium bicolor TaxID=1586634 RepID=A0AAV8WZ51_9CUCU|nr:hypothetical protein NQ314_015260 [Rhamnusium bicolor]
MPLLKKPSVKPKSAPGSQLIRNKHFKTPLLTRENIDKILLSDNLTKKVKHAAYSQPTKKIVEKNQAATSSSSTPNLEGKKFNMRKMTQLKRTLSNVSSMSVQLSFENVSEKILEDSEGKSDISYRMNEPKIKEAYLQFVKKLSQSSGECKLTSSPKTQISPDIFITPLASSPLTSQKKVSPPLEISLEKMNYENKTEDSFYGKNKGNEKPSSPKKRKKPTGKFKKPSSDHNSHSTAKKAKKSNTKNVSNEEHFENISQKNYHSQEEIQESSVTLSQEILNRKDVKTAYVNFMKSSLENDKDTIKQKKEKPKKKKNIITSTTVNNKTIHKKKNEKRDRNDEEDCHKNLTVLERMALIQESRNVGLYVICDICDKARYLPNVKDPLDLPDKWYCAMNPDQNHNICSEPEEIHEEKDYLIDNTYNAGSIVWAKMHGYPWWPAMVEDDVNTETYFWLEGNSNTPTWYHVTFFDSTEVTRAWMRTSCLKPFKINMYNLTFQTRSKNNYKSRVAAAFKQASDAVNLSLIDRLKKYSFIYRYNKPLKTFTGNTFRTSGKRVNEKRGNKSEKVTKKLLVGHKIDTSGEISLSPIPPSTTALEKRQKNDKESADNTDDFSVILNDINWTDTQNMSFNLFD